MTVDNAYSKKIFGMTATEMLPSVSVDCVIFGFHEGVLKILLNKFNTYTTWMLPGGFVGIHEDVNAAAYRVLKERTGLQKVYLTQFYLFGDCNRTDIEKNKQILVDHAADNENSHWFAQRFVSMGYYAFVDFSKVKLKKKKDEEVEWFTIDEIPPLYSDHNKIIERAIRTIRMQLGYIPIGLELLPSKFTMSELRVIYETIMGQPLDRRNFQRKILATELVVQLDEVSKKWGVKTAALFAFDVDKYSEILKSGAPLIGGSRI